MTYLLTGLAINYLTLSLFEGIFMTTRGKR